MFSSLMNLRKALKNFQSMLPIIQVRKLAFEFFSQFLILVNLLKNMEKLKNDKDTCDVILRVKKGNYYWASFWAHKSVLAAYSPVFAEALKKFQT